MDVEYPWQAAVYRRCRANKALFLHPYLDVYGASASSYALPPKVGGYMVSIRNEF